MPKFITFFPMKIGVSIGVKLFNSSQYEDQQQKIKVQVISPVTSYGMNGKFYKVQLCKCRMRTTLMK